MLTSLYWGQNNLRLLELITVWIFGVNKAFEVFIGMGTKLWESDVAGKCLWMWNEVHCRLVWMNLLMVVLFARVRSIWTLFNNWNTVLIFLWNSLKTVQMLKNLFLFIYYGKLAMRMRKPSHLLTFVWQNFRRNFMVCIISKPLRVLGWPAGQNHGFWHRPRACISYNCFFSSFLKQNIFNFAANFSL